MFAFYLDSSLLESLLATVFMSLSMALVGTICVVKKKSLNGEMLSHMALPGVAISYLFFGSFSTSNEFLFSILVVILTFIICVVGQKIATFLIEEKFPEDATLCLMLSFGLGLGIFIQSLLQKSHPVWFKKSQLFFFGQAATLLWEHVYLYLGLAVLILAFILTNHTRLKWYLFDKSFYNAHHFSSRWIEIAIDLFITLAIVIGIRSCGVVLVSGMLIIPVITARCWSCSLGSIYLISSIFAGISALIGNYLSFNLPIFLLEKYDLYASIALGPMMIIVAFAFCLFSLIFAPKTGLVSCTIKQIFYSFKVLKENGLKRLWKARDHHLFSIRDLQEAFSQKGVIFYLLLTQALLTGVLKKSRRSFELTKKGIKQAAYIVRVHRLFELYLTKELHVDLKNVHAIAEELEHVISEDIEQQMSILLNNPKKDPHHQPIPEEKGKI